MSHGQRAMRRIKKDPKRKWDFRTWWFIVSQNLKSIYTATRILLGLKRNKRHKRKKKGRISKATRIAMLGPWAKCVRCGNSWGEATLTLDHIIPASKGGNGHKDNCQVMCENCNQLKGAKTKKYHQPELKVSIGERMKSNDRA